MTDVRSLVDTGNRVVDSSEPDRLRDADGVLRLPNRSHTRGQVRMQELVVPELIGEGARDAGRMDGGERPVKIPELGRQAGDRRRATTDGLRARQHQPAVQLEVRRQVTPEIQVPRNRFVIAERVLFAVAGVQDPEAAAEVPFRELYGLRERRAW